MLHRGENIKRLMLLNYVISKILVKIAVEYWNSSAKIFFGLCELKIEALDHVTWNPADFQPNGDSIRTFFFENQTSEKTFPKEMTILSLISM